VEAVKGTRISVGEPYFDQMTVPIVGMILLLMGVALITPWKKGNIKNLLASAKLPALLSAITTLIALILGGRSPWVVAIIFLAGFAFFVMLLEIIQMCRQRSLFQLFSDNPRRYGGFVAHTGALMIIVAVALSATYEKEKEVTLKQGESVQVEGYTLTLGGVAAEEVPQRFEIRAAVDLSRGEKVLGRIIPQMNFYPNSREPIASPAVRSTLLGDLYLTLIHFEKDGSSASLRAIVTPAVAWIWIGGGVVMLGGLLALSLGHRRGV
jgi:cytochrome c-type biogenesis protein CcmF